MDEFKTDTLFVCKQGVGSAGAGYPGQSRASGLYNSTRFIVEALEAHGKPARIVIVRDNNDIDREVALARPRNVIVEALWVVPEKFDVLRALHPGVSWFVHLHSHVPFLAQEGIALEWLAGYRARGVGVIVNSQQAFDALRVFVESDLVFLPNVYLGKGRKAVLPGADGSHISVGCFGAIRPLKNTLLQALAAIQFARERRMALQFHVNVTRVETGGDPVLKNLRALFATQERALIEHGWFEPSDFVDFLQANIDISLQVSLSETFNVVTADAVTAGVPIVVSDEVPWASDWSQASDDSVGDIVSKMHQAWQNRALVWWNQRGLRGYVNVAIRAWLGFVG